MANKLIPQNDAEKQVIELLKRIDVRAEFVRQELANKTKSTHDAVAATAPEAVAVDESIKEKPLTAMPFPELAALLAPKGVNLQQQLDDHVSLMLRRGIVKETEAETYKAKFNTINVRKSELENISQGYRPMLFVDDMTPVQAAKAFVHGAGIGYKEWSTLADFTKRDPKTLELLNQSPSGLARLTFVSDITNLTPEFTGKNADFELDQMKQGKHSMEPAQWFQMFAEGLEKAIRELKLGNGKDWKDMTDEEKQTILNNKDIDSYLPDTTTWTQFPEYRNQLGRVLDLDWHPDGRGVRVYGWHPGDAYDDLGVRPSLG